MCVVSETNEPRGVRRFKATVGIPMVSLTYEGELLRRDAERLREEFTKEKRDQLLDAIHKGAGNADTLRAQAELDYFIAMFQVNSSERGARQLAIGTWVLALATIGLFAATVVLAWITATHGA